MTFAEDKVRKHIRNNLPRYQNRLHVNEMLHHLPCLTEIDKQQIRASVDRHGNNDSVWVFFDHLQRKPGWVQQLLDALHETHLEDIEKEIKSVYESHQVNPPSRPSATPAPLEAENGSRAAVIGRDDSNNLSLDVRQRNVLEPGQVQPVMSYDATRSVFSTPDPSLQDAGDYNIPIQETKRPSSSNVMVVKPKNTGNARKPESSTPIQNKSEANARRSLQVDKQPDDWVTVAGNTSCVSPNQGQLGLGEMPADAIVLTTPANSRSSAGNLVQNWDSCQHHPVNKERFGRMTHLTDRGVHSVSKEPELTSSPCPRTSENQPEENYYSASDNSLLTPSSQDESQERESLNPQVPSTMPSKRFGLPSSDAINSSSTEVILPVSPTVVSGAPNDMVTDRLKSPVQVTDPSLFGTTTPNLGKEEVTRPSRNIALDPSRASHISNTNEEDYIPCKPGVLTSEPGEILRSGNQIMSGDATNPAYSGGSDRLRMSDYSGNDPLMVSELTQSGLCEERCSGPAISSDLGRNETTARTSSFQSENGNHLDDGSVRVLQGRIVQPPSVELTEAPPAVDLFSALRNQTPSPLPDSVADHSPISSANSHPENSNDAHPNKKVTDETPSLWGNLAWPAVGLALAFGALVLLRWLKK